jgi:hypothetical protein
LHVPLTEVLHHGGCAVRLLRRKQKVDVIGHQDVGMDGALPFDGLFCQCIEEVAVVVFGKETG